MMMMIVHHHFNIVSSFVCLYLRDVRINGHSFSLSRKKLYHTAPGNTDE